MVDDETEEIQILINYKVIPNSKKDVVSNVARHILLQNK
jgi:hypothetical protein